MKTQYATIPIEKIEIKRKTSKLYLFKIIRLFKTNNIVIKIGNASEPYIEEVITKNKIGLNKNDSYNFYIPGDLIYNLCTERQAYLTIKSDKNYYKKIKNLFF